MKFSKTLVRQLYGVPVLGPALFNLNQKLKSTEHIFTHIYKTNGWGAADSISGSGSEVNQTRIIVQEIPKLLIELQIATMLDIPCGDFHWMKAVDRGHIKYVGADIVEELICHNTNEFATSHVRFQKMNLLRDELPEVDLIFCRDCLVHLSVKHIFQALRNICLSQSKYLLTTTFSDRTQNSDIQTGQWRSLNLQVAPFFLPEPDRIINEGCTESGGIWKDKSLALWKISDIDEAIRKLHDR